MRTEASGESAPSLSGRVLLGRYRVVRPLARGGMGVVYLGRVEGAAGFAKPVVIKALLTNPTQAEEGEHLFAREARIVSHLQHPGIVSVFDFGQVDGTHVMVLEYVHGYNLGQWFRYVTDARGAVPVHHATHIVLGVLDALDYAHRLTRPDGTPFGIVHRDISPGNVLIDDQGRV
ncbi:MAG TPA: serine/threonine-protein kinase, partial [Polyangiaceae bacterium]|nr:serine/threonine-protein kinase [Polyangiaceae bacterium]